MCCNLQYTVCGGIHDKTAGLHMFFTVFFDHDRTGIRLVADDLSAGFFLEGIDQLLRKSVREVGIAFGEIMPAISQ